jgi:hypothetical protein
MGTEWFRTAAIQINARYVLDDGFRCLHCKLRRCRAYLVYEIGFFNRVCCEDGTTFAIIRYNASESCVTLRRNIDRQ